MANTLVVYWLYQTSVCNSGSPGSGPTSSGASLQFTNSTGDFTLLMVDGTLPRTQVSWLGWDAGAVANGTTLAAIHHPGGAYKRISFGTAQANTADHIRCNWTSGVTEGGSSGSVLMVTSTQRFIGDLTGGPSACGAAPANLYDTYGFLNYNYNNDGTGHPLQAALAAGTDDSLEQNDSCAAAIAPASSSYTGLVVKWQDEDWYRFTVANGASLGLTVSYTQANGDVDVEIYDGCGGPVVASGHGTSGTETINYTNTSGASKTYYARVYLVSDTRNTYNLTIGGGPPPAGNDACSGATGVAAGGTYTGTTADATNDGQTSCGTSNTSKDRWFTYTATANGTLSLDTCGSGYDTVLSVHSGCPGTSANSVACNDDAASGGPCTGNASALSMAVTSGTTYKIRVSGYNGASGAFTLHVGFTGSAPDNNACASATAVSSGGTYTGTTATATNDGSAACGSSTTAKDRWYTFTAPQNATLKLDTCGSGYDTVLSVHTACPGTSANSVACNDDGGTGAPCTGTASYVSMAATSGATYKIRVSGYNGASGTYTLHVTFIPGAGAEVGNDLCNTAQEVFDGPTPFANGNAGTDGPDEPGACDAFGYTQVDNDVWFRYAAVCDGPVTASTCGSDFDTKMMVYAACPEGSGGAIACNDDAPAGVCAEGTLQSQLTFEAAAGNGYIIRVGGFRGARGSGTLNISHSCDGGTPCPADFNEDGGVDGADVISFFGAWERGDSNADTNQDGGVDGDDVAVFFLAWQAGGC